MEILRLYRYQYLGLSFLFMIIAMLLVASSAWAADDSYNPAHDHEHHHVPTQSANDASDQSQYPDYEAKNKSLPVQSTWAAGEEPILEYPAINYGKGKKARQLKHGEYLVKLGDCIACHTEEYGGKLYGAPFAGGRGFKTPFGKLYSPNITPDRDTGIGKWSLADFTKAMREGVSPQGHYYYPVFPFYFFNKVTDQDIADMKAYLDAITPVRHKNYSNEMLFPFSWRFLQLEWRLLFFNSHKTGPYKLDPVHSAAWNRGAYIVLGLGHCDMCHTPMHYIVSKKLVLGVPDMKYHLTGAFVQGYHAPNITNAALGNASSQDIAAVFKQDRLIGGGKVEGPMAEANHDSFRYLTDEDVNAIVTYLRSVHSTMPAKEKTGTGLAAGKKIYNQYCAGCHRMGVGGAPKMGDAKAWEPRVSEGMNVLYQNAINGIGAMPAKGTCASCSDEDIKNTVKYMVNTSIGKGGNKNTATAPLSFWRLRYEMPRVAMGLCGFLDNNFVGISELRG